MPRRPTPVCPVCRRRGCTDPEHKPKQKRESGWHRKKNPTPRSGLQSAAEKRRRRETVKRWIATHGPVCPGYKREPHMVKPSQLTADHTTPVSAGGSEHGPLGVLCRDCQNRQGSDLGRVRRAGGA